MTLKNALACAAALAVAVASVARSEEGAIPGVARPPAQEPAHATGRLFSFEMVRCPPGQPYLELFLQLGMPAGIDLKTFFTAPPKATIIARNVSYSQLLNMIGDATNMHIERRKGMYMLTAGAPACERLQAKPYKPGPEADPFLRGDHITIDSGFTRNDFLDVILRMMNANVVVDPAVMATGDCNVVLQVKNGGVADALAQLGVRAEERGDVVYILPLADGSRNHGKGAAPGGPTGDKGGF